MEELKRRLEVLLGAKPEAPVDETQKADQEREAELLARRDRVAAAGGELLGAAFQLPGRTDGRRPPRPPPPRNWPRTSRAGWPSASRRTKPASRG